MIRTNVYKSYKKILNEPNTGKLLKQQVFLSKYINDNYKSIDKMLLFHGIGTGKTRTSITIAETIKEIDPKMRVLVILPARLKTNFMDSLKNLKDYEIISYDYLRNLLQKSKDYKNEISKLTKNRIILIDEVHNLLGKNIKESIIDEIIKSTEIDKDIPSINAVILRLLTKLSDKTAKFFFLTATPIFDNYKQFIQLILNLKPDVYINKLDDISYLINLLKGKISSYNFNDKSIFPKVIIDNIKIPITDLQVKKIKKIENDKFCINERQILISGENNLKNAPKLQKLFELLKLPGKHVVYSNFIKYCLNLIIKYLRNNGWTNYFDKTKKQYKTYILWDGNLKNKDKIEVKKILNSYNNIDGKYIKLILGSPSIKEGISFKHVQHLHQIDPVWNKSAKDQIEGRVIRYKSHEDISKNNQKLKREVVIHNYIGVSPEIYTCDQKIYEKIMIKKQIIINEIEKLLKKVAIDYYLWNNDKSPKSHSKSSIISVGSVENKIKDLIILNKTTNKCPKLRRPNKDNICYKSDYKYLSINKYGNYCCYKKQPKINNYLK